MKIFNKTIILILIILNLNTNSVAHNLNLNRYSYHLIGVDWKNGTVYNSTGFFIRESGRLFFITAGHALSGWNSMQLIQNENHPNEVEIILHSTNNDEIKPFNIDVRPYKNSSIKLNINKTADIEIIELNISVEKEYKIYSIENHITPSPRSMGDTLKIFGFSNSHPAGTHLRDIIKDETNSGTLEYLKSDNYSDSIYHEAKTIYGFVTQGFSGAPVFKITSDQNYAYFNGVCVGGDPGIVENPKLLIVNTDIILKIIQEKLSKNTFITKGIPSTLGKWISINGL